MPHIYLLWINETSKKNIFQKKKKEEELYIEYLSAAAQTT